MKIKKVLLSASLLACTFVVAACTTKKPKPTGDKPGETTVIPSTGETPVTSGDTPVTTSETPEVEKVTVTFMVDNDTYLTKKVEKGTATSKPADPIKDGFDFKCWLLNGEEFNFDTEIDEDITLAAEFEASIVELTKIGFGPNLTSWKEIVDIAEASADDNGRYPLGKDVSDKGFTFASGGRVNANYASYNTQSGTVTIVVPKASKLVVNGTWGSTSTGGKVYVKNGSTAVYTSDSYAASVSGGTQTDISFELDLTTAGTYVLSADKAINIKEIYVEREVSFANVSFFTEHGDAPESVKIEEGFKLGIIPADLKADGWVFKGWFMDQAFTTPATADTVIEKSTTIYAKWIEYNPDNYATVSFDSETSGENFESIVVEKGQKISLPVLVKEGYTFYGWYKEDTFENKITSSTAINETMTLYAKFVQLVNVSFVMDNTILAQVEIEKGEAVGASYIPQAPYQAGYEFAYWSLDGENEFDFETPINDNTNIIPVYVAATPVESAINILDAGASFESLYAEFDAYAEATSYNAYVKSETGSYTKLDTQLIRKYKDGNKEYYRVDALGLKAGKYTLKVAPVVSGSEVAAAATEVNNFVVKAHDRSGFAFVSSSPTQGDASGAYNADGTLKAGAQVIYVTNENAKTVKAVVDGNEVTGLQAIIKAKQKKASTTILDIRIIGTIYASNMDYFESSAEGLQIKGANSYQNMKMTIEGVGNDAGINGFGILIRNCSNVELRNFAVMNCMDDSVSVDTDNSNLFIHNLDMFYGQVGGDSDQAKGDGTIDLKLSQYITVSYNHYFDSGKASLMDAGDQTSGYVDYVSFHHNWFDHSDSRHPRVRNAQNVHIYNNYYDGNSKYGVASGTRASIFAENNYFRSTSNTIPFMTGQMAHDKKDAGGYVLTGDKGGLIKVFGNVLDGENFRYTPYSENQNNYDAYDASDRNEVISSSVYTPSGVAYSNFDTASTMYQYDVESAVNAKNTTIAYAGRVQGGDFKWVFTDADDSDDKVNLELKTALQNYSTKLVSVQGIESSGSGSDTPTPVEVTVDDVIAMIEALPEATAVTINDRQAINNAKTAFNSLSEENQALVTNADKLAACVAALSQLAPEPQVLTFPASNNFFTVSGSTSTSKGTVTYNGVEYKTCLKMESKTTIDFTLDADMTITIVLNAYNNVKIDGDIVEGTAQSDYFVITKTLEAGSHSITRKDSSNIFYISLE